VYITAAVSILQCKPHESLGKIQLIAIIPSCRFLWIAKHSSIGVLLNSAAQAMSQEVHCCGELHARFAEQQSNGQISGMLLAWQQHWGRAFEHWLDTSKAEAAGGAAS
jgi:hypothetical protein